jgi:hypothetical protein
MAADKAQPWTEAKALDADFKRSATAIEQVFEQRFQAAQSLNGFLDFLHFAASKFPPARTNRSFVPQTVQEEPDLAEGKAHVTGQRDE